MDTITKLVISIDNPLIKTFGTILHENILYAFLIVALVFVGEKRTNKRLKIGLALLITLIGTSGIKIGTAHDRPCITQEWCPKDYSFPSIHAAIAFTLMIAFLNKPIYPFYLFFALFVAFTRMNLGMHVFEDIAGALPFSLLAYYITDLTFDRGVLWIEKLKGRYFTFQ